MSRNEYMAALRRALSGLPEEERASALRYYEEYFDDAGPENEQKVISELGAPEKIAEQILADYRELTAVPHQEAGGAAGTVFGLLAAAAAVVFSVVVVLPLALLIAGVVLCGFSFALWGAPASAVVTLGCGLALSALGILVTLLMIKLCILFVPPLVRGLVAIIRWPLDKLRARNHGGGTQ